KFPPCNEPIHSPSSPNRDHLSRHPDRRAFPSKLTRHKPRSTADTLVQSQNPAVPAFPANNPGRIESRSCGVECTGRSLNRGDG
ncbi:hypothetical protein CN134_28300, partial [Sinorhizobium meliloti]